MNHDSNLRTVRHKNIAIKPDKYIQIKEYAIKNNMHVNEFVWNMFKKVQKEGL